MIYMASNCLRLEIPRNEVVKQLMDDEGIEVHSYGGCLHNKEIPKHIAELKDRAERKLQLFREYKVIDP